MRNECIDSISDYLAKGNSYNTEKLFFVHYIAVHLTLAANVMIVSSADGPDMLICVWCICIKLYFIMISLSLSWRRILSESRSVFCGLVDSGLL